MVTMNTIPANPLPTAATMRLIGFYTPWYDLTIPERKVRAIASYLTAFDS